MPEINFLIPSTRLPPSSPAGAILDKYLAFQALNDRPADQMTPEERILWVNLACAIAPSLLADLVELKRSSEAYAIQAAARIKTLETQLVRLLAVAISQPANLATSSPPPSVPTDGGAGGGRGRGRLSSRLVTAGAPGADLAVAISQPADLVTDRAPIKDLAVTIKNTTHLVTAGSAGKGQIDTISRPADLSRSE